MNNAKEITLKGVHIGVPPVVLRLWSVSSFPMTAAMARLTWPDSPIVI